MFEHPQLIADRNLHVHKAFSIELWKRNYCS